MAAHRARAAAGGNAGYRMAKRKVASRGSNCLLQAFRQGLGQVGYFEGKNVTIGVKSTSQGVG
jgi:hypothetical protein